jgi:putative membrane protein
MATKRPWPLWAGLFVLAATWLGPLPAMARAAFSPGMIAHLAVVALAAPLIAIGVGRLRDAPRLLSARPARVALGAFLFDAVIILGWHIPALHDAAARSWMAFSLEQVTFLAAGLAMWCFLLGPPTAKTALWGAAAFCMTFTHMTMLGCLLLLAPHLLYDPDLCRGAFGLPPLDDQRVGGALMLGWGSFAYLAGGVVLLRRVFAGETDARSPGGRPAGSAPSGSSPITGQPNA